MTLLSRDKLRLLRFGMSNKIICFVGSVIYRSVILARKFFISEPLFPVLFLSVWNLTCSLTETPIMMQKTSKYLYCFLFLFAEFRLLCKVQNSKFLRMLG